MLGIESRRLLLDCPEGSANGYGRQLARNALGQIEVGGKGDAEQIVESYFAVVDRLRLREGLVPLLCKI